MKLLIVDDHPLYRDGLAAYIQHASLDWMVLQANDAAEGLEILERHPDLDIAVVDLQLPGTSGMAMIREFTERRPALPVVVLSSSEAPCDVRLAFASGARGYVPKSSARQTLLTALDLIMRGHRYVPELMVLKHAPASGEERAERLTDRQLEVLRLMATGLSNKEIGHSLKVAEKTVKAHITDIFRALGASNRTQATAVARQRGLI